MIPFNSKLSKLRNIEKRNAVFQSLSNEEKRKEIAYDVLTSYKNELIGRQKEFGYWPEEIIPKFKNLLDPVKFQSLLIKNEKNILCSVCARGALMVSRIKLGNQICGGPSNEFIQGGENTCPEFSDSQLESMEEHYEDDGFLRYAERTPECIAAIFANILANGHFDKSDKTDYLKKWKISIKNKKSIIKEVLV